MKSLTKAELNHLRKLLGWVSCEIGQSPDEMKETLKAIVPAIGEIDDEAKQRLVHAHEKSANVPKYVRQAVKALGKTLAAHGGDVIDAESGEVSINLVDRQNVVQSCLEQNSDAGIPAS